MAFSFLRRNVVKRYQCGLPRLLARFPAQKAGGNPAGYWLGKRAEIDGNVRGPFPDFLDASKPAGNQSTFLAE